MFPNEFWGCKWRKVCSTKASDSGFRLPGAIINLVEKMPPKGCCIDVFGATSGGQYPKAWLSTTRIIIGATTTYQILSCGSRENTPRNTCSNFIACGLDSVRLVLKKAKNQQRNGMVAKPGFNGTKSMGRIHGLVESASVLYASAVEKGFGLFSKELEISARNRADRKYCSAPTLLMRGIVRGVKSLSWRTDTGQPNVVQGYVQTESV